MKRRKFTEVKKIKLKNHKIDNGKGYKCACGLEDLFSQRLPLYLFLVVLCIRIYYVLEPKNWWLLHPDEIFQSIEVAFSEIYGHGFRTYEYCPPLINITTAAEEQEMKQGMYSLRSFIFPQFFATVLTVCKSLGITRNSYVIGRISHCVVTSITPVCVYRITRTLFRCQGIAILSTILASFSLHLSVLGTHSLVNSFLSPFLFFSLDIILQNLIDTHRKSKPILPKANKSETHCDVQENEGYGIRSGKCDINSNHEIAVSQYSTNDVCRATRTTDCTDRYHEISASSTNPSISENYPWTASSKINSIVILSLVLSGFVTAVICYIRPDTVVFVAAFAFSILIIYRSVISVKMIIYFSVTIGGGFLIGVLMGGAIDSYKYGVWFISPMQWLRLNAASHIPAILYGALAPYQYIYDIFAACKSELCVNIVCAIALLMITTKSQHTDTSDRRSCSSLMISLFIVLFVYSFVGHKEIRFLYNALIILTILTAYALHGILQYVNSSFRLFKHNLKIVATFILFLAANTYFNFPGYQKQAILPWNSFYPTSDSSDINQCLHFIGQQDDVTGVFLDGSIYMTASFSILYHNVPLITLIHHEYHEYRSGEYKARDDLAYKPPKNLYVINRYSDYIDVTNIHYLSKRLLESQEYNYIVILTRRAKSFNQLGFQDALFATGEYSVLRRSVSKTQQQVLIDMGRQMTIGNNATILEYEASWLYTSGLYTKAIQRLQRVIEISESRIRPFQLLSASYAYLNDYSNAQTTEDKCSSKHGRMACRQPQPRIVLHEDYLAYNMN